MQGLVKVVTADTWVPFTPLAGSNKRKYVWQLEHDNTPQVRYQHVCIVYSALERDMAMYSSHTANTPFHSCALSKPCDIFSCTHSDWLCMASRLFLKQQGKAGQ